MAEFLGIIPARYASTRLPGKPLADLLGKPLIQHVYERVAPHLDHCYVATDDQRIEAAVQAFGGNVVMTSDQHRSGTERCFEAYEKIGLPCEVVLNIQGDEPFIYPIQLEQLKRCFDAPETEIATLVKPFAVTDDFETQLFNPNIVKVAFSQQYEALYFSRAIIPYIRRAKHTEWLKQHTFYHHIGIYGYRAERLKTIASLPSSTLEEAECLEQLKWLDHGMKIKVAVTHQETIGIDTEEELEQARRILLEQRG